MVSLSLARTPPAGHAATTLAVPPFSSLAAGAQPNTLHVSRFDGVRLTYETHLCEKENIGSSKAGLPAAAWGSALPSPSHQPLSTISTLRAIVLGQRGADTTSTRLKAKEPVSATLLAGWHRGALLAPGEGSTKAAARAKPHSSPASHSRRYVTKACALRSRGGALRALHSYWAQAPGAAAQA